MISFSLLIDEISYCIILNLKFYMQYIFEMKDTIYRCMSENKLIMQFDRLTIMI